MWGHRYGPNAPEVAEQLATQDRELARLIAGIDRRVLWEITTLILVSDHGMAEAPVHIDVEKALVEADIKATVTNGPVAHVYLDNISDVHKAVAALRHLDHINVFTQANTPAAYRLAPRSRTGDVIITTEPPYRVGVPKPEASPGSHGFHPSLDDMKAIIFAMGYRVRHDEATRDYHQIDLAKTITYLLKIEAPLESEGKVMGWVLN